MDYENTDILITDVHLATMEGSGDDLLGKVDDAALAVCAGNISWLGPISKLPSEIKNNAKQIIEADGRWITPGLVDCHSHVIYGGNRAIGATVRALDLRAGAALSLLGLVSEGETTLTDAWQVERGYNDFVSKLKALGASIEVEGEM